MERTGTGFDVVKLLHDVEPFLKVKKFKEERSLGVFSNYTKITDDDLPKTRRLCVQMKTQFFLKKPICF